MRHKLRYGLMVILEIALAFACVFLMALGLIVLPFGSAIYGPTLIGLIIGIPGILVSGLLGGMVKNGPESGVGVYMVALITIAGYLLTVI